uniref:Uncharacterized protein n=1 Tax=Arundo donax TaxID=35708 RepID=A0A0A9AZZ4_ARUDO
MAQMPTTNKRSSSFSLGTSSKINWEGASAI